MSYCKTSTASIEYELTMNEVTADYLITVLQKK